MSSDFYTSSISPYAAIIIKICRADTNTQEDFEDYYQEVCLQIWRTKDNFQNQSKWSTWIDPACPQNSSLVQEEIEDEVVPVNKKMIEEEAILDEVIEEQLPAISLAIFPNPTKLRCNIVFTVPESGVGGVDVYNNTGMLIKKVTEGQWIEQGEYKAELDTSQLPAGIYSPSKSHFDDYLEGDIFRKIN